MGSADTDPNQILPSGMIKAYLDDHGLPADAERVVGAEAIGFARRTIEEGPLPSPEEIAARAAPHAREPAGVYFLLAGDEIVYVGQSLCPSARIREHAAQGRVAFDRTFVIRCDATLLNELEASYIHLVRPAYNRDHPTMRADDVARLALRDVVAGASDSEVVIR